MPRAFAEIAFTPGVQDAQSRYGSREANRGFERDEARGDTLGEDEIAFIAARDSFYLATVAANGWPYVQHRGGPPGFLRVLDARTLAFADFRGNRQYLSVGNLRGDDRVSLILMDYAQRRRLKLWGRVRVVDEAEDPALLARVEVPTYRARVERTFVIHVEAFDWNCPQHITPRYTEDEVEALTAPLHAELAQARRVRPGLTATALGEGDLSLRIVGVRELTPRVRAFELRRPDGRALPPFAAGAHLRLPVVLPDGTRTHRHYSLSGDPARADTYEIAVQRDDNGAGGSRFVHEAYALGSVLRIDAPRQHFALPPAGPVVLVAGGIGITPLRAMAYALRAQGRSFVLHYAGRRRADIAYLDDLRREFGEHLLMYVGEEGVRLDVDALMAAAPLAAYFMVCGPNRLIEAVRAAVAVHDPHAAARVMFERFAIAPRSGDEPFTLVLQRSSRHVSVRAEMTALEALLAAGVRVPSDCRAGQCGACAVTVLEGEVDHRDVALGERERSRRMCVCVSRARSDELVLDL